MGDRKSFSKAAATIDEQVRILKQRNLVIADLDKAKHYLSTVSYYRLSGYFKPFQQTNSSSHLFKPKTTFENIWSLYVFDRELRLLISDAIERIEVALRTALSNSMSLHYGNLWYLDDTPFSKHWLEPKGRAHESPYDFFKREINHICARQKEEFIKHYFSKYNNPPYPPAWMVMECLSFGKCTSLFRNLKKLEDKKAVCKVFDYHPRVIESCLEPLRYIRNICAHHARLWNRWFVYIPKEIKAFGNVPTKTRSFHEQALMIDRLHQSIAPHSSWKKRLHTLFENHEESVPFEYMGFGDNWRKNPIWTI